MLRINVSLEFKIKVFAARKETLHSKGVLSDVPQRPSLISEGRNPKLVEESCSMARRLELLTDNSKNSEGAEFESKSWPSDDDSTSYSHGSSLLLLLLPPPNQGKHLNCGE